MSLIIFITTLIWKLYRVKFNLIVTRADSIGDAIDAIT